MDLNGKTYFFKGSEYWRYQGVKMETGYPMEIADGFTGVPDNVDAVMVNSGILYFFKGSKYWKYHPRIDTPVDATYPRSISGNWQGAPDNIDAAMYKYGTTYMFKDDKYYGFQNGKLLVSAKQMYTGDSLNKPAIPPISPIS